MSAQSRFSPDAVRDDFIPAEDYFDRDFARAEAEKLWPKVWQIACRLEEIPAVGDYVTYDILRDSIIVVRSGPEEVHAFHNVCPHRGNRITEGNGTAKQFVCSFHGWRFGLNGRSIHVVDHKDWGHCLPLEEAALSPVKTGIWAGWVFINMSADCQPLDEFLEPMKSRCDRFEFEKLRFAWYRTTKVAANWKTALEAFTEFYHVQATHRQMLSYTKDYSTSRAMGRHGWISYDSGTGLPIGRSDRLPPRDEPDFRNYILEYAEQFKNDLGAMQTKRAYDAAQRLRTELTADAAPAEVLTKWGEFTYEAAIQSGAGWPENLTLEYLAESGFDWHVFPNTVFLHPAVEAVLWYRVRPCGDDPEQCLLDIWSLERFPEGEAPALQREHYEDWREGEWPLIYRQDFINIPKVQKGLRSRGFKGMRPNPVQERAISNFHLVLRRFLQDANADNQLGFEDRKAAQ